MFDVVSKYIVCKLFFPVDGNMYNVMRVNSVDGGKTFWYCGVGKYCKDLNAVNQYLSRCDFGKVEYNFQTERDVAVCQ